MGFLDGARYLGFIVKAIKTICTWAYKLGVLALLIIVFLVAYMDLKPAWLWFTFGFAWFIVHWIDFFFVRTSNTGEKHVLVYLYKKLMHSNTDVKGVISAKMAKGDKYPDGIVLGRDNAKKSYIQQGVEEPGSIAIIGQAGSGKSQEIISTLLSYGDGYKDKPVEEQPSILCVDVKAEFLPLIYDYRHNTLGRDVKYLSFGERVLDDMPSAVYDIFSVFKFAENPIQAAQEIANALIVMRPDEKQPHFPNEARALLSGLLYCMADSGVGFADAIRLICGTSIPALIEKYCIKGRQPEQLATDKGWMILSSFYDKSKKGTEEFNSVLSTMLSPLRSLATNDNIINALDTKNGYSDVLTPADLVTGDVFLCIREQYLDPEQPNILNVIISQYLSYFSRTQNNTKKRTLFILDEYTRLGKLPIIDGINLYRSKGLRFMLAMQSTSQIEDVYGTNGLNKLMDGCDKTIVLSAKGNSAKYFSDRVGEYEKTMQTTNKGSSSQTMQFGGGINSGTSESQQLRKVFQPSFFESELVSNQKELILSTDGYRIADVCFAWNDPIISSRADFPKL